ncbi:MAG: hypothetical protein HOL01_15660 [Planctomycetaceae bacterium]|jgi:hypothetical protein|nr:hypothetical protein [Planctomycetaceae bacterium]MBT6495983.1 hypothetical protein [Planctomycetaceae bacterium]
MRTLIVLLAINVSVLAGNVYGQNDLLEPAPPASPTEPSTAEAVDRVFGKSEPWIATAATELTENTGDVSAPCYQLDSCYEDSCCNDLWTRQTLTNGFWGAQSALAQRGIFYKASVTQFYQGVTSGGAEQTDRYGGKLDQYLIFDGGTLGLWDGLKLIMHTETAFGENSIFDATGLAPVNMAFLTPRVNEHVTAITNFQFEQDLGGRLGGHHRQDQHHRLVECSLPEVRRRTGRLHEHVHDGAVEYRSDTSTHF